MLTSISSPVLKSGGHPPPRLPMSRDTAIASCASDASDASVPAGAGQASCSGLWSTPKEMDVKSQSLTTSQLSLPGLRREIATLPNSLWEMRSWARLSEDLENLKFPASSLPGSIRGVADQSTEGGAPSEGFKAGISRSGLFAGLDARLLNGISFHCGGS